MELEYKVPVRVIDEYMDGPSMAVIVLNGQLIKRILKLSKVAKELKCFTIRDWDYTPEYKVGNEDEEALKDWDEGSIDGNTLDVGSDAFHWRGYIKHTDIAVETDEICLVELEENIKVLKTRRNRLPLLMGDSLKYATSKLLLEKRLKEAT